MDFNTWFAVQMGKIGYAKTYMIENIESTWMSFLSRDLGDGFHVCYLKAPMSPEAIQISFNSHNEPVLFMVNDDLVNAKNRSLWIRALHAIYYGRVYTWKQEFETVFAAHYDESHSNYVCEQVDIKGILFTETDSKLRDFPGVFRIARFYDRPFLRPRVLETG